jgi:hypothetical protein
MPALRRGDRVMRPGAAPVDKSAHGHIRAQGAARAWTWLVAWDDLTDSIVADRDITPEIGGPAGAPETWRDLMARCIGWVRRDHDAVTYVLDDGRHVDTFPGAYPSSFGPAAQCPTVPELTAAEAHRMWAEVYVPGPEYQARLARHARQLATYRT